MRLLVILAALASGQAQTYDLLLKGGHVIDPKNEVDAVRDVAIRGGRIAAVSESIPESSAKKTLRVDGLYVTPGLVDLHTHLFSTTGIRGVWAGDSSVRPDDFSFRTGCTTMVDAGSSGWRNFDVFKFTVIDRAKTRVLALINIAGLGMITDVTEQKDFDPKALAALARAHKQVVVGVKSAHYRQPDWESVNRAVEAGTLADIPVMVDFGSFLPQRPYWQLVTERLRPGDASTHCFRAPVPWIDPNGKLYPYLEEARRRGVMFDVGHGGGSFVFRNAAPAIAQGFYPDTISTDLHTGSMNGAMIDMPTTMSKFLALGMPLNAVIRASTWSAAQWIRRPELGHLSVGAEADVAVWNLMKGEYGFVDYVGGKIQGRERLFCELTLRAGTIAWDWNGRAGQDYHKLPADYGIRPGNDHIIAPPPK